MLKLSQSANACSKLRSMRIAACCIVALSLAGCTTCQEYIHNCFKVGPNYHKPPAAVAATWIDADDSRVRTAPDDLSKWWSVFNDPILNALICDAYKQNLTLREAGYRVLQARAEVGIAVGNFFPQTQVMNGDYNRTELSLNVANSGAPAVNRTYSQWDLGFALSWELDFWGRFRRAIESAEDRLEASVFNYDDVLVTLLGDVANNYVQLRTFQQQLEYVQANVKLQKESLDLAKARFHGGEATELDVDQAQSNLSQTEAQIPQLEIQIRRAANRLCVLLGIPTEDLTKKLGVSPIPTAPPDVGVGMPADLLRRRPDVRRNERLAAAQSEAIGIAESELYPAISITGQLGYSAEDFSHLFAGKSFRGSIGPAFQWNILNYGRIVSNVQLQDARFLELITRYQNSVLRANEEVENGIVSFLRSQEAARSFAESVKAAEKAVKVAVAQYKGGLVDFNRVSVLQQNLVEQQNQLAQAQGNIALGLIQIYRALGGGWEIRCTGCDEHCLWLPAAAPKADAEQLPTPKALPAQNTGKVSE